MGVGFFKNDGHRDGALWLKEMQAAFAHVVSCWVFEKTVKMFSKHGNIPYMFDCWHDPIVHLLLLKSSMPQGIYSILNVPSLPKVFRTVSSVKCNTPH